MRYVFANSNDFYFKYLEKKNINNILMSYAYKDSLLNVLLQNEDYFKKTKTLFFVDSGAFTSWTKGQKLDVVEYGDFLESLAVAYPEINFKFINLDVIPGKFGKKPTRIDIEKSAKQGWKNYEYLKSRGLNVLHIFHQFEDEIWLRKLADSSDYIGLSPANDRSVKSRILWLRWVFSIIGTTVKTHGFGFTSKRGLYSVPFYSADSSSWMSGVRWGQIFDRHDIHMRKAKYQRNTEKLLNMGIDYGLDLQAKTTDLWKARGVDWK